MSSLCKALLLCICLLCFGIVIGESEKAQAYNITISSDQAQPSYGHSAPPPQQQNYGHRPPQQQNYGHRPPPKQNYGHRPPPPKPPKKHHNKHHREHQHSHY